MNISASLLCVTAWIAATSATKLNASQELDVVAFEDLFLVWTEKHGKVYESAEEELQRLLIWIDNQKIIDENNNLPSSTFRMGHNQFSDLTHEEFQQRNRLGKFFPGMKNVPEKTATVTAFSRKLLQDIPNEIDWREEGVVSEVKNQALCGACWAFSATGSIESAKALATGELVSLSEQELVDCDHVDFGCRGGLMDYAFTFDKDHDGLCSEEEYPYTGAAKKCKEKSCTKVPGSKVTKFTDIEKTEEDHLEAIAQQPVSVAIDAGNVAFQLYESGILTSDKCGEVVDHGVLAVGYGTDNIDGEDVDYWLLKNSWGADWGDKGYLKVGRNTTSPSGSCGLYMISSVPSVTVD